MRVRRARQLEAAHKQHSQPTTCLTCAQTLLPRQAAALRTADSSSSRFRGDQTIPQNVRLLRSLLPRSPAAQQLERMPAAMEALPTV